MTPAPAVNWGGPGASGGWVTEWRVGRAMWAAGVAGRAGPDGGDVAGRMGPGRGWDGGPDAAGLGGWGGGPAGAGWVRGWAGMGKLHCCSERLYSPKGRIKRRSKERAPSTLE